MMLRAEARTPPPAPLNMTGGEEVPCLRRNDGGGLVQTIPRKTLTRARMPNQPRSLANRQEALKV